MGNGLTYSRYMLEYSRHIDLMVRYMEYSRNMSEYPTSTDSRCYIEKKLNDDIWKPDPLDNFPIFVYLEIYWVYPQDILSISRDIRKPHFSKSYISRYTSMSENYDTQVGHSSWLFLSCLTMCSGTPHDCTSYGGVKNEKAVWRKSIQVTPYI